MRKSLWANLGLLTVPVPLTFGGMGGDGRVGLRMPSSSCSGAWASGRCYSPRAKPLTEEKSRKLTHDLEEFHEMLAKNTRRRFKRYTPNFTLGRLSRQQGADILAYLQKVAGGSN